MYDVIINQFLFAVNGQSSMEEAASAVASPHQLTVCGPTYIGFEIPYIIIIFFFCFGCYIHFHK